MFGIDWISPKSASAESDVSIHGTGFGPEQLESRVQLNSTEMPVIEWSDRLIRFQITSGAESGPIQVVISEHPSNPADLQIITMSDVLDLLYQATTVQVTLSGQFVLERCQWSPGCGSQFTGSDAIAVTNDCDRFTYECKEASPLVWNGNGFSSSLNFEGYYQNVSLAVHGEVAVDGSRALTIEGHNVCIANPLYHAPSNESILECHDIELFELDLDESRISYRATGSAVQQLVDEFYKYRMIVEYQPGDRPGEPGELRYIYTSYKSLNWDNEDHPPEGEKNRYYLQCQKG